VLAAVDVQDAEMADLLVDAGLVVYAQSYGSRRQSKSWNTNSGASKKDDTKTAHAALVSTSTADEIDAQVMVGDGGQSDETAPDNEGDKCTQTPELAYAMTSVFREVLALSPEKVRHQHHRTSVLLHSGNNAHAARWKQDFLCARTAGGNGSRSGMSAASAATSVATLRVWRRVRAVLGSETWSVASPREPQADCIPRTDPMLYQVAWSQWSHSCV